MNSKILIIPLLIVFSLPLAFAVDVSPSDLGTIVLEPGKSKIVQLTLIGSTQNQTEIVTLSSNLPDWIGFSDNNIDVTGINKTVKVFITVPEGVTEGKNLTIYVTSSLGDALSKEVKGVIEIPSGGAVSVTYMGRLCPGKSVFVRAVGPYGELINGNLLVFYSNGEPYTTVNIISGVGMLRIPEDENDFLSVQFQAEGYPPIPSIWQIESNCPAVSLKREETGNLSMIIPQTKFELEYNETGPVEITALVMSDGNAVEGARVFVVGPEINIFASEGGLRKGFVTIKLSEEGTYEIWAEKDGYTPSQHYTITIERKSKPLPKVNIKIVGNPTEGDKIKFILLDENDKIVKWSGEGTLTVGNETFTVEFDNGKSDYVKLTTYGDSSIVVESNEFEGGKAEKTFVVKEAPISLLGMIVFYLSIFLIIGAITFVVFWILKKKGFSLRRKKKLDWEMQPSESYPIEEEY